MAHNTKLGTLTDDLVILLTGIPSKDRSSKFNAHRESALRTLRSNGYARTNHFDIQHRLKGLEEKFRIYDEDILADALNERLEELAPRSQRSIPEVLHLLLELSDKPVQNSKLHSLDFMKTPEVPSQPCYTWEQLAAEDPLLRERQIWQNIDYAADSSDDESPFLGSEIDGPSLTETSIASSIGDGQFRSLNKLTLSAENDGLRGLEEAQFWKRKLRDKVRGKPVILTELQVIREILFLLSGLPSVFLIQNQDVTVSSGTKHDSQFISHSRSPSTYPGEDITDSQVVLSPDITAKHLSTQLFRAVLTQFAKDSASVSLLRKWVVSKESVPLLQGLQHEVMARLRQFDSKLSDLQARLLESNTILVVSLTEVQIEVTSMTRPLIKLSEIIQNLWSEPYAHPFRYLELLYEETCASQMAGDVILYEYLGTIFFDCFHIYLRPIKTWMDEGEIRKDDTVFFVSEIGEGLELESIWLDRFKLRRTSNGKLHAPTFLHLAAEKIFTTGKSVVVLKQLGKYKGVGRPEHESETNLDFQTICGSSLESLAPFPELFDAAFHEWTKSKHWMVSSTLRECLFEECGLRASLSVMENLYLMADGAAMTVFTNAIFQRLDSGKATWNDRYVLNELVQSTVGSLPGIVAERLRAKISKHSRKDTRKSRLSVLCLANITFSYNLPWPVQIIITKDTIPQYQKIFTFLLQIRRSSQKLHGIHRGHEYSRTNEQALYYGLRSQLLWFTSILYGYLTDLVFFTNTVHMRKALSQADDIDGMIDTHRTCVKRMIDQALLGSKLEPIHKSVITILDLSVQLSDARIMHISAQSSRKGIAASMSDSSMSHLSTERIQSLKQPHTEAIDPDMSEDDNSDIEADLSAVTAGGVKNYYADSINRLQVQFDNLCKFVAIGLRGVARAGGEANWDMLADKLESGSRLI